MRSDPILLARHLVADAISARQGAKHSAEDVYVVWFCYILGGWKALLSTDAPDGRYYEVTYDKGEDAAYVDTYVKELNTPVYFGEE